MPQRSSASTAPRFTRCSEQPGSRHRASARRDPLRSTARGNDDTSSHRVKHNQAKRLISSVNSTFYTHCARIRVKRNTENPQREKLGTTLCRRSNMEKRQQDKQTKFQMVTRNHTGVTQASLQRRLWSQEVGTVSALTLLRARKRPKEKGGHHDTVDYRAKQSP